MPLKRVHVLVLVLIALTGFAERTKADPVEFSGYAGAGGALADQTTMRAVAGFDFQVGFLDFLMFGALVETGVSMDDNNPEALKWISDLSLAPMVGARIEIVDGLRLDLTASLGWTHLLGEGAGQVSQGGDMLHWRAITRLSFAAFKMFGHQTYLGGWFGFSGYPVGSEAGVNAPMAGGILISGNLREP